LSLALRQADDRRRTWHGYVAAAAHLGSDGGWHRWRLRLGSWLDFLALRRDTYLYQDRTALEIVEDVFRDHPQAHWRVEVTRALPR
ncbi:contractile injection system protein, VgrG/Pvc8 family, partial [Escherichia coli]|nr:contractile injection system protein, VgrG/Pvc8 family [Escherichia coli]